MERCLFGRLLYIDVFCLVFQCGAVRLHKLGLGDDDANLEDDFITWKEEFWAAVCAKFGIEASGEEFSMRQYEAKVLGEGDFNPEKLYRGEPARLRSFITQRPPFDLKNPYMAPIRVNRPLHAESSDRHCMHIEIDIKDSRIRYGNLFDTVCLILTFWFKFFLS